MSEPKIDSTAVAWFIAILNNRLPLHVTTNPNGFEDFLQDMAEQLGGRVVEGIPPKHAINGNDKTVIAFPLVMTPTEYIDANLKMLKVSPSCMPPSMAKAKGHLIGVPEDTIPIVDYQKHEA